MIRDWSQGAALVARRALLDQVRSTTFKVVTVALILVSTAAVIVPMLGSDGPSRVRLAVVADADSEVVEVVRTSADAVGLELSVVERADTGEVRAAVRDGDAEVGLAGGRLLVGTADTTVLAPLVSQAVVLVETERQLAAAGLSEAQSERLRSIQPPDEELVLAVDDSDRAAVGFLVGIVLYLALTFAGSVIATSVATEKTTRISEVLLAMLRPSQVVVGTVVAVGIVTLMQLLVLSVPALVASRVSDSFVLPDAAGIDLLLALAWFVVGFALYAFVFAAAAALVDKITEVNSVITPITLVLLVGYFVGVTQASSDPDGVASVAASLVPFSAPVAMPIRWSSGTVPVWQLVLAYALTASAALVAVSVSSVVYRRALAVTGRRVRLRDLLGGRRDRGIAPG